MNKNGFTLIELLAVIVILAVIALITVPAVMNIVADARASAAKDAAYGYIKAVELDMAVKVGKGEAVTLDYVAGSPFTNAAVAVKGSNPVSVSFVITNGEVVSGTIDISNHDVVIAAGAVTTATPN